VVLGAGTGGMPAAYELRETLGKDHRITVINALDHFQFVPSNPWLAVGWRKRDDITFPLAPPLNSKGIDFIAASVNRIDAAGNRLELDDGKSVEYDFLVITTGPKLTSSSAPCRSRVVSDRPMNSLSYSTPTCASASCARRCP
jgi:sulfide:quinone oxidoreductase